MECEDGFLVPKDPQNVLLANFVIDKRIGKGQFSEVYRAQSEIDNCIVALKKVQVQKNLFKKGTRLSFEPDQTHSMPTASIQWIKHCSNVGPICFCWDMSESVYCEIWVIFDGISVGTDFYVFECGMYIYNFMLLSSPMLWLFDRWICFCMHNLLVIHSSVMARFHW